MGAEITWVVKVTRATEDTVEVSAVTSTEARSEAKKLSGVIQAVDVWPADEEPPQ